MDNHLKRAGVIGKTVDADTNSSPREKSPKPVKLSKKRKRALLVAIKDSGFGMASAMTASIPAAYRHT